MSLATTPNGLPPAGAPFGPDVPPRAPVLELSNAWGEQPAQDFGLFGSGTLAGAVWRIGSAERLRIPELDCSLIWIPLSGGRRHVLAVRDRSGELPVPGPTVFPAQMSADLELYPEQGARGPAEFFHLYASHAALAAVGLRARAPLYAAAGAMSDDWLETVVKRLAQLDGAVPPSSLEAGHLAMVVLARVADTVRPLASGALPPRGGLAGWQVKRVREYIEMDLSADVSVRALAALCRLSPFHFARTFHATFGEPPHAYVTARRLDEARRLLKATEQSVTEISLAVGYSEPSHLARLFRRKFGIGPAEYRRLR